jgi:signal peptidase I
MRFKRQLVIAILLFVLMKQFFYPTIIPSPSMYPTLLINDYCYYFKTKNVEDGDIILFALGDSGIFYTKRIIAIGDSNGTKVRVDLDGVYVDDVKLYEGPQGSKMDEITLDEGQIFVMGDNRTNSLDSRYFGPITKNEVLGKLALRIPLGKIIEGGN